MPENKDTVLETLLEILRNGLLKVNAQLVVMRLASRAIEEIEEWPYECRADYHSEVVESRTDKFGTTLSELDYLTGLYQYFKSE